MERRFTKTTTVRSESRAEGEAPVIAGCGAVHYDGTPATEYELWSYGNERAIERILPGAFDKALARPDDVRGLFNHDADHVLGRTASSTMVLGVDDVGLQYAITPGDTSIARDVQVHLTRKDVTGSSIAFTVDEERWTETKAEDGSWTMLREILSLTLYDVGPVTFPAYASTSSGMRAAGDIDDAKRSLDAKRTKDRGGEAAIKGRLAGYAARARAIEVEQREAADHQAAVRRDDSIDEEADADDAIAMNDADRKFLADMIPHHQMAIDMATAVVVGGSDPAVRSLAGDIIASQQREIVQMQEWIDDDSAADVADEVAAKPAKKKPMSM